MSVEIVLILDTAVQRNGYRLASNNLKAKTAILNKHVYNKL